MELNYLPPQVFNYIFRCFVIGFNAFLNGVFNALPWLITAEMYPTWARSTAMGMCAAFGWILSGIYAATFFASLKYFERRSKLHNIPLV